MHILFGKNHFVIVIWFSCSDCLEYDHINNNLIVDYHIGMLFLSTYCRLCIFMFMKSIPQTNRWMDVNALFFIFLGGGEECPSLFFLSIGGKWLTDRAVRTWLTFCSIDPSPFLSIPPALSFDGLNSLSPDQFSPYVKMWAGFFSSPFLLSEFWIKEKRIVFLSPAKAPGNKGEE